MAREKEDIRGIERNPKCCERYVFVSRTCCICVVRTGMPLLLISTVSFGRTRQEDRRAFLHRRYKSAKASLDLNEGHLLDPRLRAGLGDIVMHLPAERTLWY